MLGIKLKTFMVPVFEKMQRKKNSENRIGDSVSSYKETNYQNCKYVIIYD